ncbi:LysR family transcriptional regulator [Conexibacter sp. W3-3-2]|uniref:LysR family transcriptional regulator n=1 Tax=Conexibacter sp. W3-3-2 TaxID=2675227 RepID=UPI0012B84AE3|nr:LysR family transcriptional regulator [Conexibacter sp. W3-3-2]MTD43948.1 LysR family transcriptional regulator [Conexibacter sp. W3-3-2]
MLDVKRLRVLREVASRGSFSAAADALSYTQSAISQQIAALEREAGTTLVERSARGVRLTEAGEALVRHTDAILARLADAEAELEAIAGLRGGRLRLAAFPTAAATVMPRAIAAFRERHPAVELSMVPMEPDESVAALKAGEVDIATVILDEGPPAPQYEGIELLHLLDDPMYAMLPIGHEHAGKARLRLADLSSEKWMLGATGTCPDTQILLRACLTAGFQAQIAFHSDDYLAIQGLVASGLGIALVPDLALVAVRDDVVVRALTDATPVRRIFAATLCEGYCSPAATAMLELLAEVGAAFCQGRRELALAS